MKSISKKMMAVLICLIFISTVFASATAIKLENKSEIPTEEKNEITETGLLTKVITLYRHGLDGSVEAHEVEIEYREGDDLEEIIAQKCEEKFFQDTGFIDFLKNLTGNIIERIKNLFNRTGDQNDTNNGNNNNGNDTNETQKAFIGSLGLVVVRSRGRGFHLKPRSRPLRLMKGILPFRVVKFVQPFIFARYNNQNARTTLTPLVRNALGSNVTKEMTGVHSTLLLGFAGWATWSGYTSGPLNLIPRVTIGISNVAISRNRN